MIFDLYYDLAKAPRRGMIVLILPVPVLADLDCQET